ncbi:3-phytase [Alteromonas sp. KUL156]|nr:3-phytase [Alteromonas sp. KUL154]GFE02569.1 3-phytase [Alteromonas sp. KUL156]
MNNLYKITITCLILSACKVEKIVHQNPQAKPVVALVADAETDPVTSFDDAADDPCVWINPADVTKSTIIGTNKKEGLEVYNLEGKRLYSYKIGRVNNVDIRDGFLLNGKEVSVVTASNRTYNTISILIVKPTGELEDAAARKITSNLKEVYGLGMYKSPKTNKFYVFMVGKKGGVEQWELFENNTQIDAKLVREFSLGSQGEGIVADDVYAKVYIGEENKALWKYDAEPNAENNRVKVISTNDLNMKDDFEGVTLYDAGNGKGYIILSSQGNNSYAVFDRVSNQYLGSFSLKDGAIDGTYDTDGIDVTSVNFGTKYPKGFFIAQDGANTQGKDSLHQNFKIIDWQKISKSLHLDSSN